MRLKKNAQYIPLAILIIAITYSLYIVSTTNVSLVYKHYWGMFLVLASLVAVMIKSKIGKILTFLTLLVGTLNFIAFTPVIEAYSFGFSLNKAGMDLKVQPFSLWIFLLFIIVNVNSIRRFLAIAFKD
jgi:hypothetical protein